MAIVRLGSLQGNGGGWDCSDQEAAKSTAGTEPEQISSTNASPTRGAIPEDLAEARMLGQDLRAWHSGEKPAAEQAARATNWPRVLCSDAPRHATEQPSNVLIGVSC